MKQHRLALLAITPVFALGFAGCARPAVGPGVASANGGGAGAAASATPQASLDPAEQGRRFAECMRGEGIDMPDPEIGEGGKVGIRIGTGGGQEPDKQKVAAAMEKCRHLMPNKGEPKPLSPEDLARAREHARCMRENGIPDFPDPQPDGGIRVQIPKGDMEAFEAASEKCRQFMPGPKDGKG
jgi:hypothetical protein